jgi:cytochrome c553
MKADRLKAGFIVAAAVLAAATVVRAHAGDVAAGKRKAMMCQVCHGLDGQSRNPDAPHLSGQIENYLVRSLKAYRDGERKNEQMSVVASALSDEDIADLAAYYASIKIAITPPQ